MGCERFAPPASFACACLHVRAPCLWFSSCCLSLFEKESSANYRTHNCHTPHVDWLCCLEFFSAFVWVALTTPSAFLLFFSSCGVPAPAGPNVIRTGGNGGARLEARAGAPHGLSASLASGARHGPSSFSQPSPRKRLALALFFVFVFFWRQWRQQ